MKAPVERTLTKLLLSEKLVEVVRFSIVRKLEKELTSEEIVVVAKAGEDASELLKALGKDVACAIDEYRLAVGMPVEVCPR